MKKLLLSLLIGLLIIIPIAGCAPQQEAPIGMAVEFMNHAACAYTSIDKGWYEDEGLNLSAYDSYATGMALANPELNVVVFSGGIFRSPICAWSRLSMPMPMLKFPLK